MTINKMDTYIQKTRKDYPGTFEQMRWLTAESAADASARREKLLSGIFGRHAAGPGWMFARTKLTAHGISPGCTLCGQGDWSCLFINNICNARCFYCPSDQNKKDQPMTSTLIFSKPSDYADYVNMFNIKGVSFSGGEPFMTFDRVLSFLKTLRSSVTHPLYIWMYTNGLLVTRDKLKALKDNGLDEIRFDISANQYRLDALKKAVGIIPHVTVEIPAIPEDIEKTKQVIKELYDAGVDYLNLHQIRCTPFNQPKLTQKGYTFVHGPGVTVLETELAAIELIAYALDQKIDLPINYCSFTYRNQFQRTGGQQRCALKIKKNHEDITAVGRIRTLSVCGAKNHINAINQKLVSKEIDPSFWKVSKNQDQLYFNISLWPFIDFTHVKLKVGYSGTRLKSSMSYQYMFKEIFLNNAKKVVIERQPLAPGILLSGEQIQQFYEFLIRPDNQHEICSSTIIPPETIDQLTMYEFFSPGLAKYY